MAQRRRKPPGPPNFPTAVPVRPGSLVNQPKPTSGHGPPPPHRSPLGQVPQLERAPGQKQARQAARRVQQSRPAPVLPQIPVIARPTPAQTVAARKAITDAVHAHAKRTGQTSAQATKDLKSDPRAQQFVRAASHYARMYQPDPRLVAYQTQRDQVHAGRLDHTIDVAGLGAINASALSRLLIGATSLNTGDIGPRTAFKKVTGDVGALTTGPFIGGYEAGAGLVDVARGRGPGRLERLGSGIAKGFAQEVQHPLKYAGEHPLLAALDVAGTAGVTGRIGGLGARAVGSQAERTGVRGALARVGSTVRPPIALGEDAASGLVQRTYSKDLVRKSVQVTADRRREPLKRPDGSIVTTVDRGRRVPVLKATPLEKRVGPTGASIADKRLERVADDAASRANAVERLVRDRAAKQMAVHGVKGQHAKDLVSMAVEGTLTSAKYFEADLRSHRARIAAAVENGTFRHSGELASAKHRLSVIDRALASPKIMGQADKIVAAGESIGRKLNDAETTAVRLGILHPDRAARSRLVVPAVEHMGARHFSPKQIKALGETQGKAAEHGALRHPDGKFLSNAQIEDALRAKGRDPGTVAYLPHRFDVRGRRAFHTQFRPEGRPQIDKPGVRTGAAYAKGATEASPGLIQEQGARLATQTAKAQQIDKLISDHGLKHPAGRYYTGKEAKEAADRIFHDTGEHLVPVRAFGVRAGKKTEEAARSHQDARAMETLHQRLLNDRLNVKDKGNAQNVVLMPKPLISQLQKHLQPSGGAERFMQVLRRPFVYSVLPQPRWLTGNFFEPFFVRLPTIGSGANIFGLGVDIAAARKVLRTMERSGNPKLAKAATEIRAQQLGALEAGLLFKRAVRRTGAEAPGLTWATMIRNLPVFKQTVDLLRIAPDSIFKFNTIVEQAAQRAALGHMVRADIREFTGSWTRTLTLQRKAVEEVAKGLVDTPTQRRYVKQQYELLGKYDGFSPAVRKTVQSWMPFIPWFMNSTRFMFWTLPAHHSALEATLLKASQTVQQDWDAAHANVPPGSLKLALPTAKGGWIDLARYTPAGAFSEPAGGGSFQGLTSQFAPQFAGAQAALEGKDPFGRDLVVPKTADNPQGKAQTGQLPGIALNSAAEALVPFLSTARRLQEKGGTPYATSTAFSPQIKPGSSSMSAARRTFDPFRPTYLKQPSSQPQAPAVSVPVRMDPLTRMRHEAAQRSAASRGTADAFMELRRKAAARRP